MFLALGGDNMSRIAILAACDGLVPALTAESASAALSEFEQDASGTIDQEFVHLDSVGASINPSFADNVSRLAYLRCWISGQAAIHWEHCRTWRRERH